MADLVKLRDEVAEALLKSIKASADAYVMPDQLKDLAEAYALVVSHTNRPASKRPVASPGAAILPPEGPNLMTQPF